MSKISTDREFSSVLKIQHGEGDPSLCVSQQGCEEQVQLQNWGWGVRKDGDRTWGWEPMGAGEMERAIRSGEG